jgi:hypothetical protein
MIEEEFDVKHLDLIKREIDKYLETVGGFLDRTLDDGSSLYVYSSLMVITGGQTHIEIPILRILIFTSDNEKVKITTLPDMSSKLSEILKDTRSKIVWSGAGLEHSHAQTAKPSMFTKTRRKRAAW